MYKQFWKNKLYNLSRTTNTIKKTYFEKIDEVEEKNKKIDVKAKYNNTKKVLKKKKKD